MYKLIYWLYIRIQEKAANNSLIVRGYRRIAERFLTVYFVVNPFKPRLKSNKNIEALIVSLTTFPDRIDKVWLVVESIFYQSQKPDRIILWLYEGDFESKASLPNRLLNLEKRGIEIRFCEENLMPHIKYYYSMKENPSSSIITIDDDLLYPPNLIQTFCKEHQKYPNAILCCASREIKFENSMIGNYSDWPKVTENRSPSYTYLIMGVGGVFYPEDCLNEEVYNLKNIKKLSLKADDLWLKVMSLLQGSKVRSLAGNFPYSYLQVFHENTRKLSDINIGDGNNDRVFKELLSEYKINMNDYLGDDKK